jgi:hypothetical protein
MKISVRKAVACPALAVVLLLSPWICRVLNASSAGFSYSTYQRFLDKYVVPGKYVGDIKLNVVDYDAIQGDMGKPGSIYDEVLQQLADFDPNGIEGRQEQIAFWINAYNIGAIKIIMDHYPVDSIRSTKIHWLKNPWNRKILTVGNTKYSLGQIEHDILLGKYSEPLAHFAIVCASLSCPDLSPTAFRGGQLMEQMERQARLFLENEKKGLRIDRENAVVYFSMIFKFDKKTFPNGAEDAIPLITRFIAKQEDREYLRSGAYESKYIDYNWYLNTLSRAR